jgi:hypothetical protein
MPILIAIGFGLFVTYETVAYFTRRAKRNNELHEEARKMRIRQIGKAGFED